MSVSQHVVTGLAAGGIYALLGLALVLVHRTTGVVNVAQAELATLSAFVCFALTEHGWAFWPAVGVTVLLSLGGGVALYLALIRPLQAGTLVTVGLFLVVNGLDTWIWGGEPRQLHRAFSQASIHVAGTSFSRLDVGVIGVALAAGLVAHLLFGRSRLGLGLRAVAANDAEAARSGVPVRTMVGLGWGIATAVGAVGGILAAQLWTLEPNMLRITLLYAVAAAVIGGFASAALAVVGGFALGVTLELLGAYVHWIGADLQPAVALAVIVVVLLVRRR